MGQMDNLPPEGAQLTEEERLAQRANLKEEIKELDKGNQDDEARLRAYKLKGELFDISNHGESFEDLQESVDHYKNLIDSREVNKTIGIGAIMNNAWGDRVKSLEQAKQMPGIESMALQLIHRNGWITKETEGPVGGNEILE